MWKVWIALNFMVKITVKVQIWRKKKEKNYLSPIWISDPLETKLCIVVHYHEPEYQTNKLD